MIHGQSLYPDPAVQVLDPRFEPLRLAHASVEHLYDGCRWSEGPAWFGDGRYLLWSDVPNNRILRWDEATDTVGVFRQPSDNANGNTRDREGRLVTCEHLTHRVTRTEYDGAITVLADSYQGKPLNSPNDVVVKSDGSVWFSDPAYGISGYYEGQPRKQELPTHLYRLDGKTGELTVAAADLKTPNGLAFSPDESRLYVVESRGTPRCIRVFDVEPGGRLAGGRILVDASRGGPDGLRVDVHGNLWCGWGEGGGEPHGVRVFTPEGEPIGHIELPERCANVCFGGRHRNRLFMAAGHGLYALYVNTQGAR